MSTDLDEFPPVDAAGLARLVSGNVSAPVCGDAPGLAGLLRDNVKDQGFKDGRTPPMNLPERKPPEGTPMASKTTDQDAVALPRISVDFKIPLWGVMGVLAIGLTGLVSMYFQVLRMAEDVTELKAVMRANNATTLQFAQEQALMKFRLEKLEASK